MLRARAWWLGLLALTAATPAVALAEGLSVDVTTERGNSAVYQPGERIKLQARCSDDANMLIYDIDAEGQVTVLFPYHGQSGYVPGRQNIPIPDQNTSDDLVVQGPVGQGYIVAIASRAPFRELPWYLRPYDPQAEGVGYVGGPDSSADNDDGVTAQGRIVGDPFVAMERIRRRVLNAPDDRDSFGSSYITYYVHEQVRYPRYVCNDCHRPGYYAWWDGFDPYYTTCSVVSFHVNFGWYWGWPYWGGYVPYYVYVVNPWAPPFYRPWSGYCYSSWDGWSRWNGLWGSHIIRYKPAAPPPGYIPPSKYQWDPRWQNRQPAPPGFLTVAKVNNRAPVQRAPATAVTASQIVRRTDWRPGGELRQPVNLAPRETGVPGVNVNPTRGPVDRAPAAMPGEPRAPSNNPGVNVPQRGPQAPAPAQGPAPEQGVVRGQRPQAPTPAQGPAPEQGVVRGQRPPAPAPAGQPQNYYQRLAPPGGSSWRNQRPSPAQGAVSYRRPAPPSGSWRYQRPAPAQSYGRGGAPARGYQRPTAAPSGSRGGSGGSGRSGGHHNGR